MQSYSRIISKYNYIKKLQQICYDMLQFKY